LALTRQSQAAPLRSLCNEVHVWHIVLSQYLCQVDRLLGILDPSEQRRAVRLNGRACRTPFIIAHAAVRIILGRYLEVEPHCLQFAFTSYGKPYLGAPLGDQRLEFSLSHCEHIALLAISRDRRVGIDVEQLRELNVQDMAIDVVCSKTEIEPLRQLAPGLQSRAFYHLWT
jgi:4'-phosphopantetheinyl transferase